MPQLKIALAHIERFGIHTTTLVGLIAENLTEDEAALLRCNSRGLFHDPPTVAALAAELQYRSAEKAALKG